MPPANANILAEKLQEMSDDKLLLQKMSQEALLTANTYGNWDVAVRNLAALLNPVLQSNMPTTIHTISKQTETLEK